ncbi:phage portal protein family protein [Lignipirellula cremea]|uniref:Phage portal protein n=1 Tax=Lignipirellula cremea TaxID=2528010 RepID=A0A518E0B5_9BACT|nr:DUF935 family protein [Lignipirellula cremea]QDU97525.1 hypothetical protein Pla8534_53730 [Lignipirellula cremea]
MTSPVDMPLQPSHLLTIQGAAGDSQRLYRPPDEAIRHSLENARFMRNECGVMECLEARQRGSALLPWRIIPEEDDCPAAQQAAAVLTRIVRRIPHFLEYRRNLLEALWYGKYAVAQRFGRIRVGGQWRIGVTHWEPRHGDKLVFRAAADGNCEPDQIGIRVSQDPGAGNQPHASASEDPSGETPVSQIETTSQGKVYFLRQEERDLLAVHRHIIEDGPPEDPFGAGGIHGVGIRSRIYWSWYSMQECLAFLMEYLERSALGIEVWSYPSGNAQAEAAARQAAEERISGGRSIVLVPKPLGDNAGQFGVEHIEPGLDGAGALRSIITDYFGHKIKRYILGQTLTSETGATGLGSGVAETHAATWLNIVRYDAQKLAETLTTDLVEPLCRFNFSSARDLPLRLVLDVESPDIERTLAAWKAAYEMGLQLKAEEVANLIGAGRPGSQEEALGRPV